MQYPALGIAPALGVIRPQLSRSVAGARRWQSGRRRGWAVSLAVLVGAACGSLTGCVERRMTIRTNVDNQGGALVYVDNQQVGVTPASTDFTYYADREIRLIKDGYETQTVVQPVPAPWWDCLLVEFFVENLLPFTLRDEREFSFTMQPPTPVTTQELLDRAHQLRTEGQVGAEIVPAGRTASAGSHGKF